MALLNPRPRIIIVDDSTFTLMMLKKELEATGFDVIGQATDGEGAVCLYAEFQPDAVLMDIIMPKLDGIAALGQILRLDPEANVIMLTSMGMESQVAEAKKMGAKAIILKPYQAKQVSAVLYDVIGSTNLKNGDRKALP